MKRLLRTINGKRDGITTSRHSSIEVLAASIQAWGVIIITDARYIEQMVRIVFKNLFIQSSFQNASSISIYSLSRKFKHKIMKRGQERGRIMSRKRKKELEQTEEKTTIREKLADRMDISKEIILDVVLVNLIGDRELTIENYKSIMEYSDTCIIVRAKPYNVKVVGTGLEIRNINRELLFITGRIYEFSFLRG